MFEWIKSWFRKPEPERKVYKIELTDKPQHFTVPPDCRSMVIEYIGAGGEGGTAIYGGGGGGGIVGTAIPGTCGSDGGGSGGGGGIAISGPNGGPVVARGGRGGSYGQPGEPGEFKTNMTPEQLREFMKTFNEGL